LINFLVIKNNKIKNKKLDLNIYIYIHINNA
jgi:hypothetical protein